MTLAAKHLALGLAAATLALGCRMPLLVWALGWSLGYEAFFAELGRLDPMSPNGAGALLSRKASAGAPRLGLQLLSAMPAVARVSDFSPTSAWGVELFVEAPHEWSGAALGSRLDVGVSVLTF